jgi:hypothetical protein
MQRGPGFLTRRAVRRQVDDDEIFKICTEYWNFLADDLYHKEVQMQRPMAALMLSPTPVAQSPRLQTYSPILAQARRILIDRMPKPEVPSPRPTSPRGSAWLDPVS